MSIKRYVYAVQVGIRSPFLFQGQTAAALGLDASAIRDEYGRPIIPADHLRGLIRVALGEIHHASRGAVIDDRGVEALLGSESPEVNGPQQGEQNRPSPGRLIFSDLSAETMADPTAGEAGSEEQEVGLPSRRSLAHRVKIDNTTGAAEEGMLQTVELVAPPNAVVLFRGSLIVYRTDTEWPDLAELLKKAIRLIPAMGALKTAGFGETVADYCEVKEAASPAVAEAAASRSDLDDHLEIDVCFDRPIIVNAQRVADNVFIGSTVLPGSAIKGALARRLEYEGLSPEGPNSPVGQALSQIVISHAYPCDPSGKECDHPLPLSLISEMEVDPPGIRDALLDTVGAPLFGCAHAPAFSIDWKSAQTVLARSQLGRPESQLSALPRGHTAITEAGVADDARLFVTIARGARDRSGTRDCKWRFRVARNGASHAEYLTILNVLLNGLDGLGRTDATMTFSDPRPAKPPEIKPVTVNGQEAWLVLLETPAVLTDPDDDRPVADKYADYFTHVSGAPVQLLNHFARRTLAGGYLAVRRRGYGRDRYCPFELTCEGSVFLIAGSHLKAFLERVSMSGLPAVRRGNGTYEEMTWRECPFVPGNGFGAISVDGSRHQRAFSEGENVG